jgi:alpha-glucoside transport system substrate-binding protein
MRRKRNLAAAGVCAAVLALTSGCLQDPNASGGGSGSGISGTVDGGTADDDQVVSILGAFGGDDEKNFNASLATFEKESGIDVQYTGDIDFATTVKQKVNSGDAPDLGFFPQPGGLLELAADDKIQPIDTFLDYDALDGTLIPGFLDASRMNGRVYGAPMRMALKSLVWYPTAAYTKGGYSKAPKSIQELARIADKIKAGGVAPWCMGWEADQATGWVGTDWIEEYVLRMYGPDVYDQWVAHDIPFNDDRIVKAYDEFGKLVKTDGNVLGGVKGILNTPFADAMTPAFSTSPKCMLHRQGNFATAFYPAKVQKNLDAEVGLYVFPPFEGGYEGQPIMGGADIAALFNGDDKDAIEVMKFLTSDKFGAEWAKAGGWLSPHATFDASNYPDETTRKMAKLAADADVFRYDASDVMPKEIGSGSFWTGMVDWLDGSRTSKQATTDIEESWPAS